MKQKNNRKKEEPYYWPLWLSLNLSAKNQKKAKIILPQISRAQIFLWRALNIYDDFLDGEARPENLPLANQYYGDFLETHYRLSLTDDYYRLFNRIIKNLNTANRAEALKSFGAFPAVYKSLALALGPLALLSFCGYKMNDTLSRATLNFFRHILATKQLADDSLDWLEDLKNGLITDANRPIILAAKKQKIKIDLERAPETAYLLYATEASPLIIKNLKSHCRSARRELIRIGGEKPAALIKLITPFEKSCQEVEAFRAMVAGM
ncbi:MAG: hypothetical protein WC467_00520 [Patescibacteria group bacterium]